MKKLILGVGLFAFSFGFLIPNISTSQIMCGAECNEKYWTMAQIGPNTFCCVESTNPLDTCSGISCP